MTEGPEIREGIQQTARLPLYSVCAGVNTARPRVLFLGGSNFDLRLKRAFLKSALVEQCAVATYEPRGIGRTGQPPGDWTMQDYAEDAIAFLDGIGWHEKVSVVGESFGGMTALHLAVLAPERINRMVIASATAGGAFASYDISSFLELPRRDAAMQSLYLQDTRNRDLHRCDPEAFERLLTDRLEFATTFADPSVSSGGYVRLLQARRQHDCISQLDKITMPVTVIAGKFDRQAPVESQQALVTALPDATIHTFDQGHGVLFNSPAATQAAISALV